ncbi:MAG: hypothetical protein JKX76_10695 [Colwellia sp.]|nr:hypothetical protein [Colwellia sp.]
MIILIVSIKASISTYLSSTYVTNHLVNANNSDDIQIKANYNSGVWQ